MSTDKPGGDDPKPGTPTLTPPKPAEPRLTPPKPLGPKPLAGPKPPAPKPPAPKPPAPTPLAPTPLASSPAAPPKPAVPKLTVPKPAVPAPLASAPTPAAPTPAAPLKPAAPRSLQPFGQMLNTTGDGPALGGAVPLAQVQEPKIATGKEPVGAVMVVGGGIGGMQASLDLANAGFKVYLVESSPAIGGRMAQLDKTFPTNDCAMCTISPKLIEVGRHPDIQLLTNTNLQTVDGDPGHLRAKVTVTPRYVDIDACTGCGDCAKVCPVEVPDLYNMELKSRNAIYKLYPQAIPGAYSIEKRDDAPCRHGCPAHTNVHAYVSLTKEGKHQEALDVIRRRIPLPGTLGRICHHPCEGECRRAEVDTAISIAAIKRHAADNAELKRNPKVADGVERPEAKVAVVGSGPAGLTCADDLASMGYDVTIFEATDELGGMLRHGIPHYRLPRKVLDHEISVITDAQNVEVKTGVRIGKDVTLPELKAQGFGAVFVGVGAEESRRIPVPGNDKEGVLWGIEFLKAVNSLEKVPLGRRVVVIGGGNVAMDVARCARRLGAEVEIACLESAEEIPASPWEVEEAIEEGCKMHPSWGPLEIQGPGKVSGIKLKACTRVFDDERRFAPQFDESKTQTIQCDQVILAIGQASNVDLLKDTDAEPTPRGLLGADPQTLQTSVEWIFAGGDAQGGAASAVEAIRDGHEAAVSIDHFLRGEEIPLNRWIRPTGENWRDIPKDAVKAKRYEPTLHPAADRLKGFDEISDGLTNEQAVADAARCIACGVCCECYQCVEACQAKAIRHEQKVEERIIDVGAVILAPGFAQDDAEKYGEWGYGRWENVVTSLEFERLLSATGPTEGHVLRPSDNTEPKTVAWIQCVGSRDARHGRDYCSAVCCMFTAKEAMLAQDHCKDLKATVFYMDRRAYGKGFDAYCDRAEDRYDVRYVRSQVSRIDEVPETKQLRIRYLDEHGEIRWETFDMVVLSTGMGPSERAKQLAKRLGVRMDAAGFAATSKFTPVNTTRPGIFVCGAFQGPKDIPETVAQASSAAAFASGDLSPSRGTLLSNEPLPAELDLAGQEARVGVFICRCGINIASVVDVPAVVEYAAKLPGVVMATESLFTCSQDNAVRMVELIKEHDINRVVVSSCTPRTHEPLFQSIIREAGLNKYLFSMTNIRDQCSWVHPDEPRIATEKAKALTRMAVANARELQPLHERPQQVTQRALVVGGGLAGMTAAIELAKQGFPVDLVEKSGALGGNLRRLRYALDGEEVGPRLDKLISDVWADPRIQVHLESEVKETTGFLGNFETKLSVGGNGKILEIKHGATVIATGANPAEPTEYGYGEDPRVITQLDLEAQIADTPEVLAGVGDVVMIQCVGSRNEERPYCSRVCCSQAIKNALKLKWLRPEARVYVLYRDLRSYGLMERHYRRARQAGVIFMQYDPQQPPVVNLDGPRPEVRLFAKELRREVAIDADRVVLSTGLVPADTKKLADAFKLPTSSDGYYLEAHMKLRPVDFPADGLYMAGTAHYPKSIDETVTQAAAAAARATTVLGKKEMHVGGIVSVVDPEKCAACLCCVRACPFGVPQLNDETRAVEVEAAACRGCGVCASECPGKAIQLQHFTDNQLTAMARALSEGEGAGPREGAAAEFIGGHKTEGQPSRQADGATPSATS
ncbi:MAG: FAD-dependent oxidoreductase [bacterium]